ncbi:MAG: peptidase S8, partial [Candidatus Dormibacteraeota bacterium]|nr:peptidase S8 [Candidatus Dormibacteraeota bacterium]
ASGNGTYSMGATYPASSPYVTAVGGTKLTRAKATPRGWTEVAWAKTSSGCSAYEPKPAWQNTGRCGSKRTVTDTSADSVNLATYDSYGLGGWSPSYGTSGPTPMIAAVYALAISSGTPVPNYGSSTYASGASLFDITSGTTGSCGNYLCQAGPGYDGPTGNGTPNGISAY